MIVCININVNGKMGNTFPIVVTVDRDIDPIDALKGIPDIKKFLEDKITTLPNWMKTVFYVRAIDDDGDYEDKIFSMHEVYDLDLVRVRGVIDHICKGDDVIGIDELETISIPNRRSSSRSR